MRELTFKQENFCNALIDNGGKVKEAYIQAYGKGNGTEKTLMEQASRLRNDAKIIARIKAISDERAKMSAISRQHLTRKLWGVCSFPVGRLFKHTTDGIDVPKSMSELTEEEQAMIQRWDSNGFPILVDKMQAAKLIADINGLKTQNKVEVTMGGGVLGRLIGGGAIVTEQNLIDENPDTMYL